MKHLQNPLKTIHNIGNQLSLKNRVNLYFDLTLSFLKGGKKALLEELEDWEEDIEIINNKKIMSKSKNIHHRFILKQ